MKSEQGWYTISNILIRLHKSSQAENLYKIHLDKSSSSEEHMACNDGLRAIYHPMGDYAKALSSYERSLEIMNITLPPNHPDLATSYSNIGAVYAGMGEYTKALKSYERLLAISKIVLPLNHPDIARHYNNFGVVHDHMDEYSKALVYHQNASNMD
ncbi:unnamed protein product [Rotaria magnacalcarata]|uniref:Kinesin light chain n=1 Tax=Rotaria magnacalcarata TaxID=392030 RepID=A0A819GQS0_9BILA|nr:unnamed protein product [Rotaria magnacalcarata]CAF1684795.1 unnamed protein product [Rotaria magnacalcarata]CAF2049979.1 unnamed protein product [Rotaria magnacalcarata]CAF2207104.1 unnamed protein product [Rotaria magnacalcarata]CAF2250222.1 unnamed protein product [Rotaria magnacalcarata]